MTLVHYTYATSSAAYRTRIALKLKGLEPEERYVHLLKDGGQQHDPAYAAVNAMELIPKFDFTKPGCRQFTVTCRGSTRLASSPVNRMLARLARC